MKNIKILKLKYTEYDTPVALVDRGTKFCSYVVAWNFDSRSGTWGQGHYFDSLNDAIKYYDTYK